MSIFSLMVSTILTDMCQHIPSVGQAQIPGCVLTEHMNLFGGRISASNSFANPRTGLSW